MTKLLTTLLVCLFSATAFAADNPPVKATGKPKAVKPCKAGQTEADGCKVVKKAEKKKPVKKPQKKKEPAKKQAPKK